MESRKFAWVTGAGTTAGLLGGNSSESTDVLKSWSNLIQNLKQVNKLKSRSDSETADLLDEAFHCRTLLKNRSALQGSLWPESLRDIVARGVKEATDLLEEGKLSEGWMDLCVQVNKAAIHGRAPLIYTTNYDDLLARCLGWKVVYFPDTDPEVSEDAPSRTSVPSVSRQRRAMISRTGEKPETPNGDNGAVLNEIQSLEDFTALQRQGWLDRDQLFVVHLHGWVGEMSSMVFDPGDYRVVERDCFRPLQATIQAKQEAVVFVGMGEGLLDPHFSYYFNNMAPASPGEESNFWLLPSATASGEKVSEKDRIFKKLEDLELRLRGKIRVVEYENYGNLPEIMKLFIP